MMATTLHFSVIGEEKIHCEGCEQRVRNALRRLPSVTDVTASAKTQRVAVTLEADQVNEDQVRARLEQIGYQVTPAGGGG